MYTQEPISRSAHGTVHSHTQCTPVSNVHDHFIVAMKEGRRTVQHLPMGMYLTIAFINEDAAYACTCKPVKLRGVVVVGGGGVRDQTWSEDD